MKITLAIIFLMASSSLVDGNPLARFFGMPKQGCGKPPCEAPKPEPCPAKEPPCEEAPTEPPVTEAPVEPCPEEPTPAPCPEPCPEPPKPKCEEPCPPEPKCEEPKCKKPNPCCGKKSKKLTIDPCAKQRAKAKMAKVGRKGLKIAKILTASLAAPFVIGAAKATAVASAIPIVMAAKGALIGKAIALPIKIMAFKTAALATGIAGLTVGVPVAIGTGIAAGVAGAKEAYKGMRKVETCCPEPPCKLPCAAAALPEPDPVGTMTPVDEIDLELPTTTGAPLKL